MKIYKDCYIAVSNMDERFLLTVAYKGEVLNDAELRKFGYYLMYVHWSP